MPPCVEILFFPVTPEYRANPALINPVLDIAQAKGGVLGAYHGIPLEDENLFLLVNIWESLEAHQALIDDKEAYPRLVEHLGKVGDVSKIDLFHVNFEGDLAATFNAPYASYAHITALKPGKSFEDLQPLFKQLGELPQGDGAHGGIFGKAIEKDDHILFAGWNDPKDHEAFVGSEAASEVLKKVGGSVETSKRGHIKFHVWKKYDP